ncbi:MAG: DUF3014 domain-containing protein [Myxococcota bacterium]
MDDDEQETVRAQPDRGNSGVIVLGVALALGAAATAYFWVSAHRAPPPPPPAPIASAPAAPTPAPSAPAALNPSDGEALLKKRLASLSDPEGLGNWLNAEGLLHRLAAAVRAIARGEAIQPMLGFIELKGGFEADEGSSRILISKASYARYDAVTARLVAFDPERSGAAWAEVRPYFDQAFAEVAEPGERFDDVLRAAIERVLKLTPPQGPPELVVRGATFLYKDPALEGLSPADKQLLRMGPENLGRVQGWAQRFGKAAGILR